MEREDEGQQVTQDDIQNVKNDISSLRFELLDAFDKNSAREKIRQEAPLAVCERIKTSNICEQTFPKNIQR